MKNKTEIINKFRKIELLMHLIKIKLIKFVYIRKTNYILI